MIWLTWRQFRIQAVTAAAALAAFAILLAITGPHLAGLYSAAGLGRCHGGSCGSLASTFLNQLAGPYPTLYLLGVAVIVLAPVVIGIFWGAPLIAHEFEARTHYLAWNQSVTRTRWLVVKLALPGLAALAVTEGLSLMQAWWAAPIGRAVGLGGTAGGIARAGRFYPLVFATHGITPLGYAAFAFALGVTAGVLIRRTVPAMAVTLAIFAAVQLAMPLWIRPHLFPSQHTTIAIGSEILLSGDGQNLSLTIFTLPGHPEAWILASGAVNAAGHPVSTVPACDQTVPGPVSAALDCLTSHGIRVGVTYEPASRYWALEWTETAIFVALALALAGYCSWQLSRRRV
ncbi:MAG TPA: ABC transporter permease [Streptosporangiaceae bacterium]